MATKTARSKATPTKENGVRVEEGLSLFKSDKFDVDAYVQSKCSINEKIVNLRDWRVQVSIMADFGELEAQDGVRMPWNIIPVATNKEESIDSEIPVSAIYTDFTKDQLLDQLSFFVKNPKPSSGVIAGVRDGLSSDDISRFLLPASDCQFTLHSVLEELGNNPWPVEADHRPARCTGVALRIAAGLLGACFPGSAARIMAFIGGPSTQGPGAIVSRELSEPIRSHKDIDKDSAPCYHKAVEFYQELAKQLVHQGHVLDVFASSVDQVGIVELKVAVEQTGGFVVLAESFGHSVFRDSLRRMFQLGEKDLCLSSCGIFEINCSKDIKVQGIIGPCASLEKKGPLCSDTVVGMCGLHKNTSII